MALGGLELVLTAAGEEGEVATEAWLDQGAVAAVLPSLSLSSPEAAGVAAVAAVVAWPWTGAAAAVVALVVVMVSGKGRFKVIPTEPQIPWAKDRVAWKHSSAPVFCSC